MGSSLQISFPEIQLNLWTIRLQNYLLIYQEKKFGDDDRRFPGACPNIFSSALFYAIRSIRQLNFTSKSLKLWLVDDSQFMVADEQFH
jgi:hypothetical protein